MKRVLYLLFLLFLCTAGRLYAQASLGENARVSLLTASPSDEEVFTLYGHSALRVFDPDNGRDLVFNYGIFNFHEPNFIFRFMLGKTDYILGVYRFDEYAADYRRRGSRVTEQILNLNSEEKQRIWEFLAWNARPENRVYRYNFFFDNCATRPRDILEKYAGGTVSYEPAAETFTFRELIGQCTREHRWYTFGCDLILGAPTDRTASLRETFFLPGYLEKAVGEAVVTDARGQKKNLVADTRVLIEETAQPPLRSAPTPLAVGCLLLAITALLTWREWRRKTHYAAVDIVLFSTAGLCGCLIFFLSFFTEHPCVDHNWNLVWLNPLQFLAVILPAVKKGKKAASYYHFINFAALTLFLAGWKWIPQQLEYAFIPYILVLWTRSGYNVLSYIKNK